MKAYQFINYNNQTNIEHIKKYAKQRAILCFDFEDSIKSSEKQYYRNCFKNIINNIIPKILPAKIGLRINSEELEYTKDLETISNKFINSILLPKIETVEQINKFKNLLAEKNITYDELIPTIETKTALMNIEAIVDSLPPKIMRLGFGHCDYNLNIKAFPFFHQDSIEYWKWIKKIYLAVIKKDLTILNSPYLELENHSFFQSMLHNLYSMFGDEAGQTALTTRQAELINQFNPVNDHIDFNKLIRHRMDLRVPDNYEKQIIADFERNNKNKTFSILGENSVLISPQEYLAAKIYSTANKSKSINLNFVGGCFPVQYDILFEDLFHQKLKRRIENEFNIDFNISIIRYEKFNSCLKNIKKYNEPFPTDILVFHIRPEPFLRLVKIYFKYLNNRRKVKHTFNIPLLNMPNTEKYYESNFENGIIYNTHKEETQLHKLLIDLNYLIGQLFGNLKYVLKKYYELTLNIENYCKQKNIKLLVLGVGYRNNTPYAKILCNKLNNYLQRKFTNKDISYIENMSHISRNIDQYFQDNGIHASDKYHELIAEILFNELRDLIVENLKLCPTNIYCCDIQSKRVG